jgi:hypothetical protein
MVGKACRLQAENPLVPLVQSPRATSNIDIYFFFAYNNKFRVLLIRK